jgi:hypothetical protein
MRNGELIPKHLAPPPVVARSELSSPMLIRDGMDHTWNPVNGQHYDSKRAYEKAVKAAGCTIVGNERPRPKPEIPTVTEQQVADVVNAYEAKTTKPRSKKRGRTRASH